MPSQALEAIPALFFHHFPSILRPFISRLELSELSRQSRRTTLPPSIRCCNFTSLERPGFGIRIAFIAWVEGRGDR
jgi:hypothetical protein